MRFKTWLQKPYALQVKESAANHNFGVVRALLEKSKKDMNPLEVQLICKTVADQACQFLEQRDVESFWIMADMLNATQSTRNWLLANPFRNAITSVCRTCLDDGALYNLLNSTLLRAAAGPLYHQPASYWAGLGQELVQNQSLDQLETCMGILTLHEPAVTGLRQAGVLQVKKLCGPYYQYTVAANTLCKLAQKPKLMEAFEPDTVREVAFGLLMNENRIEETAAYGRLCTALQGYATLGHAAIAVPHARDILVLTGQDLGTGPGTGAVIKLSTASSQVVDGEKISVQPLRSYIHGLVMAEQRPRSSNVSIVFEKLAQKAETAGISGNMAGLELLALKPYYEAEWRLGLHPEAIGRIDKVMRWAGETIRTRRAAPA